MVSRNPRIHREALPPALAKALLNVPFPASGAPQSEVYHSVGERLSQAQVELVSAVAAANGVLAANPLTEILAEHAARQVGRRGRATVKVDPTGNIMLEVHYTVAERPSCGTKVPQENSPLPSIHDLRKEAIALGIDPAPFGKAKTKIIRAINKARGGMAPPQEAKKRMKTASSAAMAHAAQQSHCTNTRQQNHKRSALR